MVFSLSTCVCGADYKTVRLGGGLGVNWLKRVCEMNTGYAWRVLAVCREQWLTEKENEQKRQCSCWKSLKTWHCCVVI